MTTNYLRNTALMGLLLASTASSVFAQRKHLAAENQQKSGYTITYQLADAKGNVLHTYTDIAEEGKKYRYNSKNYGYCTLRAIVTAAKDTINKDQEYDINANTKVTCYYDIELPFTVSTKANPVWYGLDLRDKTVVYKNKDHQSAWAEFTTAVNRTADDAYWAFTGNPFAGFRLHNKAIGFGKALWSENASTTPTMTDTLQIKGGWAVTPCDNNKNFHLVKPNTDEYLNDYEKKGEIKYWNTYSAKNDPGSCFVLLTKEDIIAKAQAEFTNIMSDLGETKGTGYVGSVSVVQFDKLTTLLASAQTREDFAQIERMIASDPIDYIEGFYYVIKNSQPSKNGKPMVLAATGTNTYGWAELEGTPSPSQLWRITGAKETAQIFNPNTGTYITAPGQMGNSANSVLKYLGYAQYNLLLSNNQVLKAKESQVVSSSVKTGSVEAGEGEKNTLSAWHLTPIYIHKHKKHTSTYETLYLPFTVKIPNGLKAYEFISRTREKVTVRQITKNEIKGKTPVLIEGQSGDYDFFIDHTTPASSVENSLVRSLLLGQAVPKYSYVLEARGGEVAFFKTNDVRYLSNAVYLAPAGEDQEKVLIVLEDPTGINSLTISSDEEADTKYYDLHGRRVTHPVKGVYLTGKGKKVILR